MSTTEEFMSLREIDQILLDAIKSDDEFGKYATQIINGTSSFSDIYEQMATQMSEEEKTVIFSHEKSIKEVVEMSEKLSMADEAKDFVELHELDK